MFRRFLNLINGKCRRWIRNSEARDPESIYEAAISGRIKRYQQLKSAAAGVIYLRSKLEKELRQKASEMREVEEQIGQAADLDEDQCALLLIQRKQTLGADCQRLGEELKQLTQEAEDAKRNLMSFKSEIDLLKAEKVQMIARLKNARARMHIQHALEQLSSEEDVRALEEVRESIQRTLAEAGSNREVAGSELEEKLEQIRRRNAEAKAEAELAEIKRRRRMPALPLPAFDSSINGAHSG
jgi:phage shock protein A